MTDKQPASAWTEPKATALLVLANGTVLEGFGLGATGHAVGEVCFNTAMTGYEEILTDPSYAGQIITFTFPHIGNVGTNEDDIETVNMAATPGARGVILHTAITQRPGYRATRPLERVRSRRAQEGSAGMAGAGRHGPRPHGHLGPALHLGRNGLGMGQGLRTTRRLGVPRGRDRLRHQAQHPAPARRQRLQGDRRAGTDLGRGYRR